MKKAKKHLSSVSKKEHGMKLLLYLRSKLPKDYSTKAIKRAIDAKYCRVNGRVEYFSTYSLKEGEEVEFFFPDEFSNRKKIMQIPILFEDEDFLIIHKPAYLVCENSVIKQTFPNYKHLKLIHRLDKETSGVLLLAKNEKTFLAMKKLFQEKKVKKLYLALVDGIIKKNQGKIENNLGKIGSLQGQTLYGQVKEFQGQRAITYFRVLQRSKKVTLLLLEPITGRTHQLRVHMKEILHPIIGDYQYGKEFYSTLRAKRVLLHAYCMDFVHPFKEKQVHIKAEIPEDFKEILQLAKMTTEVSYKGDPMLEDEFLDH